MGNNEQTESDISKLVKATLGSKKARITDMLNHIREALGAYGCVLWDAEPGSNLEATPPQGKLFVVASSFPTEEVFALHDVNLQYVSGQVAVTGNSVRGSNCENIRFYDYHFLTRNKVDKLCAVPVEFLEGGRGTLTIYRREGENTFSEGDQVRLKAYSSVVPELFQAIQDKISLDLIAAVDEIIQQEANLETERTANPSNPSLTIPPPLSKEKKQIQLHQIAQKVQEAFSCIEVSIFLEDRMYRKDEFCLQATTKKSWVQHPKFYRQDKKQGLVAWVLAENKPIKLFDLTKFNPNDDEIQRDYPGLCWDDPLNVNNLKPEEFGVETLAARPPLSFMAVPCQTGQRLYGAIRCSTAKQGPYYFSDRELKLLQHVAAQIAQTWAAWIRRREIINENDCWQKLVDGNLELNDFVQRELQKEKPDQARIFEETLRITAKALPQAEVNTVRLIDKPMKELYYATKPNGNWSDMEQRSIEAEIRTRRVPIRERPFKNAGVQAVMTGECVLREDVGTAVDPVYHAVFPRVLKMIVAPVKVGTEVFGTLDARGTTPEPYPSNATKIMTLLGSQLGLFLHLAQTVASLRKAEADTKATLDQLKKAQDAQIRTYEDLAHQIKTPLSQALGRVSVAVHMAAGSDTRTELIRVRGLCRKVNGVTQSLAFFADLARGKEIKVRKNIMEFNQLIKTLIEAAQDSEVVSDPHRSLQFQVDRGSFAAAMGQMPGPLWVDGVLFEQALNNVLDNAGKYSFDGSVIEISGEVKQVRNSGRNQSMFQITISNHGIAVSHEELEMVATRGYRGKKANWVTQEGSGIGLWIVDNIMEAHNGALQISATNAKGRTDVRLLFPL